ncbi:MAG: flippase, partial [Clostridia bacterium]|nr:flippase [Clostridia bacterium]
VVTMVSARYLGPAGYGLINYAASVVMFFVPIMQLGINSVLVSEIINHPEGEGETLGTSLTMSFISGLLCMVGVFAFVSVANFGERTTITVCTLYSILLLFHAIDMIQYWFQAKLKSKYVSVIMLVAYAITSAYKIFLLVQGLHVYWFAVSQALDYFLIAVSLLIIYKKVGEQKLTFSKSVMKRILSRSKFYIISNLMVSIYTQTDKIMLKLMIGDASIGYYSAASVCAGMTSFVFGAIVESASPPIFEAKRQGDEKLYEKNITVLYSIIIYLSLIQCLLFTFLSPLIVKILYGVEFKASVNILRVLVWYTTFSYLGTVRNIWILSENKQKYVWGLSVTSAFMNIALNAVFIPIWGVMGATVASLITNIFIGIFINFIIRPLRINNYFIWKALDCRQLIQYLKKS